MFKTPYGQTPIFCSAEPPSLQLRLSSPIIPIGSWSDHPPSLTFISPNLFRENRTFFHLKTQTSHFFTSKLQCWQFSTPSSSSQLRPCLWDQPVVSLSTERHHPHETASNQSEPKFTKKNKETKRSSLQK